MNSTSRQQFRKATDSAVLCIGASIISIARSAYNLVFVFQRSHWLCHTAGSLRWRRQRKRLPLCQEVDEGSIHDFGPIELHPVASPFDA